MYHLILIQSYSQNLSVSTYKKQESKIVVTLTMYVQKHKGTYSRANTEQLQNYMSWYI